MEQRTNQQNKCIKCDKNLNINNKIGYCYKHGYLSQGNKEKCKKYKEKNKLTLVKKNREYRNKNLERLSKISNIYQKNRKKTDVVYRAKSNIKLRVYHAIKTKGFKKNNSTTKMIGLSYEELRIYIENKFLNGMTWENYGKKGWHVDHIIPLSSAKNIKDLEKLMHYTNLQPLWWHDNLKKSNKIYEQ